MEAVWINGTALLIEPDSHMPRGVVSIYQNDGSCTQYPIPKDSCETDKLYSSKNLDLHIKAPLLEVAARLLCSNERAARDMGTAIVAGIAALPSGWLSSGPRSLIENFLKSPIASLGSELYMTRCRMRTLLQEVDRGGRAFAIIGPGMAIDVNRPNLDVTWTTIGPFSAPLSHLRIALLPDEADHVELYDIRVGKSQDAPIGISMISRLPNYSPATVREAPERVDIQGTLIGRYLPGTTLAGQLRNGTKASNLRRLSSKDLLGGVEIDLGQTFPPMSYVYLFYRVAPGHVFCAVVEPVGTQETLPECKP